MTFGDFLKPYYENKKNHLHILYIKSMGWYYLVGHSGQIADETMLYSLTKEEADRLIAGKTRIEDYTGDYRGWCSLRKTEQFFTKAHLQELARREAMEK